MSRQDRRNARRRHARALHAVYAASTEDARTYGAQWYADARATCQEIADSNGFTIEQTVGACAAISPRVHWAENISSLRTLCEWGAELRDDPTAPYRPVWGLGLSSFNLQSEKAAQILSHAGSPLDILNGPKETAFYRNIIGDADFVTVDVWATRAATRAALSNPGGRYDDIAAAYRTVARAVGMAPRDFQACVWITQRGAAA